MDERITDEARKILSHVTKLRRAEPKREMRLVPLSELLATPLLGDGEPDPSGTVLEAYRNALHYWAQRVASQVTFAEWETMVETLDDEVDFEGSVISFMENLFSEMTTKDGQLILA